VAGGCFQASIELHQLARACNDVRKGGAGCSGAADCGGAGAVCGVRGGGICFSARCRGCEWCKDWLFVNIDVIFSQGPTGLEIGGIKRILIYSIFLFLLFSN